jgi:glycosyltransferase involved in cell wall biosynthesis
MKKVLLATRPIVPPWDEASKNFAYFLAKSVSGANLTILTSGETLAGLPETVTQDPIFTSPSFSFGAKLKLIRYFFDHRGDFDVTHYLFTPARRNAFILKNFIHPTKGKTIQTVATLRGDLYDKDELRGLLFADKIVVYTDRSKRRLESIGVTNVERIYPGIDLDLYKPMAKDAALLEEFHFSKDDFIVMYNGEYVSLGATDLLVESLMHHFNTHPDSNLRFIFGCRIKDESDRKKKQDVVKALDAADLLPKVAFTDTVYDMPALYNVADVIVFPVTNMKGKFDVPLAIIEPYACGKPVILSDLLEFAEFSNPDISLTVKRGSNEEFLKALHTLERDPELRARLGKNARTFVEKHFDLKHTAEEYGRLYASL